MPLKQIANRLRVLPDETIAGRLGRSLANVQHRTLALDVMADRDGALFCIGLAQRAAAALLPRGIIKNVPNLRSRESLQRGESVVFR